MSLRGDYSSPTLFNAANAQIKDGILRLYCPTSGSFSVPTVWPECRDASITHCKNFPDVSCFGLDASTSDPVPVMDSYTLSCPGSQVTDNFKTISLKCGYDGKFEEPAQPFTACKDPNDCAPSPTPPSNTNLEIVPAGGTLKEFDLQEYKCKDGFSLNGVSHSMVDENQKVWLSCQLDGSGNPIAPSDWPVCLAVVTECTTIDVPEGIAKVDSSVTSVAVGDMVKFKCTDSNKVTNLGKVFGRTCLDTGRLSAIPADLTCRNPVTCEAPPDPPAGNRLTKMASVVDVTEFGATKYQCDRGSALGPSTPKVFPADSLLTGINDLYFHLECGLDGKYPSDSIVWSKCDATHCLTVDHKDGYITSSVPSDGVAVNDVVSYSCLNPNYIAGNTVGPVQVPCSSEGTLDYPTPWPECRERKTCTLEYPGPADGTHLVKPDEVYVKEFAYLSYSCKAGANLDHITDNSDVVDGKFRLQCGEGAIWPATVDNWPTCQVAFCANLPTLSAKGYQLLTTGQVAVGAKATYQCSQNFVTDSGPTIELQCLDTGDLDYEDATLPTCRARNACSTSPPRPQTDEPSSNLINSATSVWKEFETVSYDCKPGASLNGETEDVFEVTCDGSHTSPNWPTCKITHCVDYPDVTGLEPVDDTVQVAVGDNGLYKCPDGEVMSGGNTFELECMDTGNFEDPNGLTIPPCESAEECPTPPTPGDNSNLLPSTSGAVTEFGYAYYECKAGAVLTGTGDSFEDGKFRLQCLAADTTYGSPTWPTCVFKTCEAFPESADLPGFTPVSELPVPINAKARFRCADSNQVMDGGKLLEIGCDSADGKFDVPTLPTCRAPQTCPGSPPSPDSNSGLVASTDSDVKEHEHATYACETGRFLPNSENVVDGKFQLQCQKGSGSDGEYPSSPSWPTCKHSKCDTPPTHAGFTLITPGPIYLGGSAVYKCDDDTHVAGNMKHFKVECMDDGTFGSPTWPTCAAATACSAAPDPPVASNLEKPTDDTVNEFDDAVYTCKDDKEIYAEDLQVAQTTYLHRCEQGGTYTAMASDDDWPTCKAPTCQFTLPSGIKVAEEFGETSGDVVFDLGSKKTLGCIDTNQIITGHGKTIEVSCDGDMSPASSVIDAASCGAPPSCTGSVPEPNEATTFLKLHESTTTVSNAYDDAMYECKDGYSMLGDETLMNRVDVDSNGRFHLTCMGDGNFPSTPNWPSCKEACQVSDLQLPYESTLKAVEESWTYVASGAMYYLKCTSDDDLVLAEDPADSSKLIQMTKYGVTCGAGGAWTVPSEWPTCVPAVTCDFPPVPPAASNWEMVSTSPVKAFDSASYKCKSGFKYSPPASEPYPHGYDKNNKALNLKCMPSGYFESTGNWHTGAWPACVESKKRRRRSARTKRSTSFKLKADIQYTVYAVVEFQFVYNSAIESVIRAENPDVTVSQDEKIYPRLLVEKLHKDLNGVLGAKRHLREGFTLGSTFDALDPYAPFCPLCNQPTGAELQSQFCLPLNTCELIRLKKYYEYYFPL